MEKDCQCGWTGCTGPRTEPRDDDDDGYLPVDPSGYYGYDEIRL